MSCENVSSSSEVDSDSTEIGGEFRKPRISYTIEFLMSVAQFDACKQLPEGFDQSILSEVHAGCNDTPEEQQLPSKQHLWYGGSSGNSSREPADRWDCWKLWSKESNSTGINDISHHTPVEQQLPAKQPLSSGGTSGNSSREPADRWDSWKLRSKEINSAGIHDIHLHSPEEQQLPAKQPLSYGGTLSNLSREPADRSKESNSPDTGRWQSQHPSQKSGNTGNLTSSLQHHNGILGSWLGSKQSQDDAEESNSEFLRPKFSLLSRCSEPYRPPPFYKATCQSGVKSHNSDKTVSSGEDPGNKKAKEESWRKVSCELPDNKQLKVIKEKQEASPDDRKEDCDPNGHAKLQECFEVPAVVSNKSSVTKYHFGSVESSCINEAAEMCLKTESMSHGHQKQECSDVPALVSKKASVAKYRFGSVELPCISEAAEMYLKTQSTNHSHQAQVQELMPKSQSGQDSVGVCREEKPQEQLLDGAQLFGPFDLSESGDIEHIFPDKDFTVMEEENSVSQSKFLNWFADIEKVASNVSPWDERNGKKAREATILMDKSFICAQGTPVNDTGKANVAERGSSNSVAQSCYLPGGFSYDGRHSGKPKVGKSTRDQSLNTASGVCVHTRERSELSPIPELGQDVDSSLKTLLHDEESLIKIDDIFIFQQDEPTPPSVCLNSGRSSSSSSGSNELLESENLSQILSLPDPWSLESQINAQKLFANPSDSQAHPRRPCTFEDPRKIYRNHYNPVAANLVSHPFGQLLVEPPPYNLSAHQFLSPAMQHVQQSFNPHLRNTISPKPLICQHPHQIPYCQPEPYPSTSHALYYRRNLNSPLDVGRRGLLSDEGKKSAFCHVLQMQMRLAQVNLDAAANANGTPMNHWYR